MTGDRLGTGHDPSRGAAYVSSWVEVLDKNPQEIVNASADAQRMSNYLISRTEERQQDQGEKTQDGAVPGQRREPRYRVVLDNEQTTWRVENANDPGEKLPAYARRDFRNAFDAKQALKRLEQDQARPAHIKEARQRAATGERGREPARQYRTVPVPHRPGGRPAARIASQNQGLVRGSGRPGVRQDQFPSRTAPER